MGKIKGFLEIQRQKQPARPVAERIRDWKEVYLPYAEADLQAQGARCMDCGIPFCHQGCPLGNLIPDWNDLVYRDRWQTAIDRLHATNNFPEWTGRLCPAPCEGSCVLAIDDDSVTIKSIELAIIERAFDERWVTAMPPRVRTGKRVAVIGSGPAGLAAAHQLIRAGHSVTVFERSDRIGGLLRYGIPEFKMEKRFLTRRLSIMEEEGVVFRAGVHVGVDVPATELRRDHDAMVMAGGASWPRDLKIPGRELGGIHFAMDYLTFRTSAVKATRSQPTNSSRRRASVSSSSAGAIRAPTAWGPCIGRVLAPCTSSSCCHSHRISVPLTTPGRSGRTSSEPRARTRKGANGSSPSPPSGSPVTREARSPSCTP